MGVAVREKPKGSGIWWVFINHHGSRKAKKIGKDKRLAGEVARKIEARLTLGDMNLDRFNEQCPTLKKYAQKWLALPHDRKESTQQAHNRNLELHVYPNPWVAPG